MRNATAALRQHSAFRKARAGAFIRAVAYMWVHTQRTFYSRERQCRRAGTNSSADSLLQVCVAAYVYKCDSRAQVCHARVENRVRVYSNIFLAEIR